MTSKFLSGSLLVWLAFTSFQLEAADGGQSTDTSSIADPVTFIQTHDMDTIVIGGICQGSTVRAEWKRVEPNEFAINIDPLAKPHMLADGFDLRSKGNNYDNPPHKSTIEYTPFTEEQWQELQVSGCIKSVKFEHVGRGRQDLKSQQLEPWRRWIQLLPSGGQFSYSSYLQLDYRAGAFQGTLGASADPMGANFAQMLQLTVPGEFTVREWLIELGGAGFDGLVEIFPLGLHKQYFRSSTGRGFFDSKTGTSYQSILEGMELKNVRFFIKKKCDPNPAHNAYSFHITGEKQ